MIYVHILNELFVELHAHALLIKEVSLITFVIRLSATTSR